MDGYIAQMAIEVCAKVQKKLLNFVLKYKKCHLGESKSLV